jgi:hypothetical protein
MNPEKPAHLKSVHAGISMEPALTKRAKAQAKAQGFSSLSAYVRFVLTKALNDAADAAEIKGKKHQAAAKGKLPPRK